MSPSRHPAEDTLMSFSIGALLPGAALVVGAHLEACRHCAAEVRFLETVGGAVLEAAEPVALSPEALGRALAALDRRAPAARKKPVRPPLPAILRGQHIGLWRWAGPGLKIASVDAGAPEERVYLLRAAAGAKLPCHSHQGMERVLVLKGSYEDGGHHVPGDLCETDRGGHQPTATADGECICLVATEGRLQFTGLARFLQPILGV